MLGAIAAAACAGVLAWWLAASPDKSLTSGSEAPTASPPMVAAAEPPAYADAAPDPEQVRRAYDQVRDAYADGGAAAVERFLQTCADSVKADPRVLDFCLAADIYGSALRPGPGLDQAALARSALPPGADAAARVKAVRGLTGVAERPLATKAASRSVARPRPARKAAVKAAVKAAPARACRFLSTPAQRAACASPGLASAERRMRAAYAQALSSGANRRQLMRDQARWQVQLNGASGDRLRAQGLYERRTRELRALARRK